MAPFRSSNIFYKIAQFLTQSSKNLILVLNGFCSNKSVMTLNVRHNFTHRLGKG